MGKKTDDRQGARARARDAGEGADEGAAREARRARSLRANLRRRKVQSQARTGTGPTKQD